MKEVWHDLDNKGLEKRPQIATYILEALKTKTRYGWFI